MKNKIIYFFTNPLFISLLLTATLLFFFHPLLPEYEIKLLKKEKRNLASKIYYSDLNNNGISEKIYVETGNENRTSIIIREREIVIEQWNFNGKFAMPYIFTDDINDDNLKEIFVFTIHENKILLNCFNVYENKKYISDLLVDNFIPKNGVSTCQAEKFQLLNITGNYLKEFIFIISAGFPVHPRKIYYYDFELNQLTKSPESCVAINDVVIVKSKQNEVTFLPSTSAVSNCDSTEIYNDQFTWFMVLNKNLEFTNEPIKIGHYPSSTYVIPIDLEDEIKLFTLNTYYGKDNISSFMALMDMNGTILKEEIIPFSTKWYAPTLLKVKNEKKILMIQGDGNISTIDSNFSIIPKCKLLPISVTTPIQLDTDNDGECEYFFQHRAQEKISIVRSDYSNITLIDAAGANALDYCSIIKNENEIDQLYLQFDTYSAFYDYHKNPLHKFEYLFYCLSFAGIYLILLFLQKAQKFRIEQKIKAEKELSELQMLSIKNSIDPHFTLNIINSIGALFAQQNKEKADYVFGKYSKLLRRTILSSDQIVSTVEDEIDYVDNYLSLEQYRIKNGFNFNIDISDSINQSVKIPKMLIHTFVENAIKHGIRHLDGNGYINISIRNNNSNYLVKITDNGIGLEAKRTSKYNTGKGLKIVDQILELYYKLENIKITYNMFDLGTNGSGKGTEVNIIVPVTKK